VFGLPPDVDFSFLAGATCLQVCIGQQEVILRLHSDISVLIGSTVRVTAPGGVTRTIDAAVETGVALLSLLAADVSEATGARDGTLTISWTNGWKLQILDSSAEYESYTVSHGDQIIVV
jgi:hypothetical protein